MSIRVALVDDQELVRTGLAMVIDACDDMRVVAQAGDGAQALDELSRHTADIVLMDVQMPRMNGVDATALITARDDGPKVIVLTTFDLDDYAYARPAGLCERLPAQGRLGRRRDRRDPRRALR